MLFVRSSFSIILYLFVYFCKIFMILEDRLNYFLEILYFNGIKLQYVDI